MNFHEMRADKEQSNEQNSNYEQLIEQQSQKIEELNSQLSDKNEEIVQIEQEMYALNRENESLLKLAEEPKSVLDKLTEQNNDLSENLKNTNDEKEFWKKKAETPKVVYQDRDVLYQKCEKCVKENFQQAKEEYQQKLQKLKNKQENLDWSIECKEKRLKQKYEAYTASYKPIMACALIYWVIRLLIDLKTDKTLLEDISGYIDTMIEAFNMQDWQLILIMAWSILTIIAVFSLLSSFGDIFSQGFIILLTTLLSALGSQIRAIVDVNLLAIGSIVIIVFLAFRVFFRIWWNN